MQRAWAKSRWWLWQAVQASIGGVFADADVPDARLELRRLGDAAVALGAGDLGVHVRAVRERVRGLLRRVGRDLRRTVAAPGERDRAREEDRDPGVHHRTSDFTYVWP
jgi:hypothetical protein